MATVAARTGDAAVPAPSTGKAVPAPSTIKPVPAPSIVRPSSPMTTCEAFAESLIPDCGRAVAAPCVSHCTAAAVVELMLHEHMRAAGRFSSRLSCLKALPYAGRLSVCTLRVLATNSC